MAAEHLQIKIKSLAEEARIIRAHERKKKPIMRARLKDAQPFGQRPHFREKNVDPERKRLWKRWESVLWSYEELRHHRILNVRQASRNALIAYGYIRGRRYRQIEQRNNPGRPQPDWNEVMRLVRKFGRAWIEDDRIIGGKPGKIMRSMTDPELINAIMSWRNADDVRKAA